MGTNSVVLDLYKIAVTFQVQELLCEVLLPQKLFSKAAISH